LVCAVLFVEPAVVSVVVPQALSVIRTNKPTTTILRGLFFISEAPRLLFVYTHYKKQSWLNYDMIAALF
jgi:hypothetical protein